MFTGIVQELGTVAALDKEADSIRLTVTCQSVLEDVEYGCSIAVNGVCLTVTEFNDNSFSADVMQETLDRSSLGQLSIGSKVNLERALAASGRLDGHIVQGHVDGTGTIVERTPGEKWEVVRIELPEHLAKYVVEKGSIAVDGTSLTVSGVGPGYFEVSLIPTTLADSVLGSASPGTIVNLEVDVLAKYVERMMNR